MKHYLRRIKASYDSAGTISAGVRFYEYGNGWDGHGGRIGKIISLLARELSHRPDEIQLFAEIDGTDSYWSTTTWVSKPWTGYLELTLDAGTGTISFDYNDTPIATQLTSLEHFSEYGAWVEDEPDAEYHSATIAEWENTLGDIRSHDASADRDRQDWQSLTNAVRIFWPPTNAYAIQAPAGGIDNNTRIDPPRVYTRWRQYEPDGAALKYREGVGTDGLANINAEAAWGWFDVFGRQHAIWIRNGRICCPIATGKADPGDYIVPTLDDRTDMVCCRLEPSNDIMVVSLDEDGVARSLLLEWTGERYESGAESQIAPDVVRLGALRMRPDGELTLWCWTDEAKTYTGNADGSSWS